MISFSDWKTVAAKIPGAPSSPSVAADFCGKGGKPQHSIKPSFIARSAFALFLLAPLALPAEAHFNGAKALDYARQFVAIGPRWPTGPGHPKAEEFLRNQFKHDQLEEDTFTANTPTSITFITPPDSPGTVDITVSNDSGPSATGPAAASLPPIRLPSASSQATASRSRASVVARAPRAPGGRTSCQPGMGSPSMPPTSTSPTRTGP